MDSDEQQEATGPRSIPRTNQACQRCRSLKTRCLPSTQPNTCLRCVSAKKDCVWAEAPRRARKLRAPSRIAQVEQKIDGLVAKLGDKTKNADAIPSRPRPDSHEGPRPYPGSWMHMPVSFEPSTPDPDIDGAESHAEADHEYLKKIQKIHSFGDRENVAPVPGGLFRPNKSREAPLDDEKVLQMLSSGEADELLAEYRKMAVSLPFVVIPPGITANELHDSKPTLFLAVIVAASWKNHRRQMSLDKLYRTELAMRTIVHPRRTLGLVQSVLVYLSWYHFVFSHKTQQIFFLHHLVIGLALDIGLHTDYQPLVIPSRPKPPRPSPSELRERQRTFLGCYYLSSMIGSGLQKPNLLKYSQHMTECAQNLLNDPEYESDAAISYLISLRHIDDQIQDTLFTGELADLPLTDTRTLMHVQFMETQLANWKQTSHNCTLKRMVELSYSFTDMNLHNIALRPQPPTSQIATASSTQLKGLLAALEAGKRFLDILLSYPADEYHLMSFTEWMRLPVVIMTIARLCMPSESHMLAGWDVKAAQDRVRLELCLESLCYRLQSLSTWDKVHVTSFDFWFAMKAIIDITRQWYLRKIRPEQQSHQPSPEDTLGQSASERSGPSPASWATPFTNHSGERYTVLAGINQINNVDLNVDVPMDEDDYGGMFDFMKAPDFDVEQFFGQSIWSDESYHAQGFGGTFTGSGGCPF